MQLDGSVTTALRACPPPGPQYPVLTMRHPVVQVVLPPLSAVMVKDVGAASLAL